MVARATCVSVMGPNGCSRFVRIPEYKNKSFLNVTMVGYRRFAKSVDSLNDNHLFKFDVSPNKRLTSIVTRGELNDLWDEVLLRKWTATVVCGGSPFEAQLRTLHKAKLQKIGGRGVDLYWAQKKAANPEIPDHYFDVQPFQEPEIQAILNEDATDIFDDVLTHKQLITTYTFALADAEQSSPIV